jgi:hypothetical protein
MGLHATPYFLLLCLHFIGGIFNQSDGETVAAVFLVMTSKAMLTLFGP